MKHIFPVVAVTVLAGLLPGLGRADSFDVSLNTSSLSGSTQILAFGLNDSDGSSNTISLASFNFGAGSAVSGTQDCTLGGFLSGAGCSGSLASGVTLSDSSTAEVFFDQEFNVGSSLSFEMTTTNAFAGGIPDGFAMYLCNTTLSSCYSDDSVSGALLILGLGGTTLTPASFTLNGASAQGLPAPVVTVSTSTGGGTTMPEPPSVLLLGIAIGALALCSSVMRKLRCELTTP
jgi:hypothetical protein